MAAKRRLKRNPAVSGNNIFNIVPSLGAAKNSDDERIFAFLNGSDKAGLGGPGVSGLSVNIIFPAFKKNFVMTFQADFPAILTVNRFIFELYDVSKKIVTKSSPEDQIHIVGCRVLFCLGGQSV